MFDFVELDGYTMIGWTYVGGFAYEASQDVKYAHHKWATTIQSLGFKVGVRHNDGTVNYYVKRNA